MKSLGLDPASASVCTVLRIISQSPLTNNVIYFGHDVLRIINLTAIKKFPLYFYRSSANIGCEVCARKETDVNFYTNMI